MGTWPPSGLVGGKEGLCPQAGMSSGVRSVCVLAPSLPFSLLPPFLSISTSLCDPNQVT